MSARTLGESLIKYLIMAHCHVIFVFCMAKSSQQQQPAANSPTTSSYSTAPLPAATFRWYVGFLFGGRGFFCFNLFLLVGKGKNSPVRVSFNLCCSPFL